MIGDALARVAQFLIDLALARLLAEKYIPLAVAKHVEEALISALEALLLMAAVAVVVLAAWSARTSGTRTECVGSFRSSARRS
jgi:hypothetical protein